ncbi:hypothetical protein [Streptomyces indicus]|uniref:Uncharacterized protein n=1 Tax=Streptomyces indicus TaxID=417292 RepID=A0A1G8UBA8_9ACTN|nr:hypothetical protein [Streptomyces indicus]SDJ51032.1 hypothetical protein SAMN05421806_101747 [Streptomyces indicus]
MTRIALTKTAIDEAATAAGLKRLHARGRRWTAATAAIALAVPLLAATGVPIGVALPHAIALSLICGGAAVWLASLGVYHARHADRILRTYPWQTLPCEHVVHSENTERFRIKTTFAKDTLILQPVPYSYKLEGRSGAHPTTIWYAGPPSGKGVVSPVGGHFPVRVVPITGAHGPQVPSRRGRRQR